MAEQQKNYKRAYGEYMLGLDIGTESIGWAVTDENYRVLQFGKKSLWGVRLFPEAQPAQDRRGFRVARRRIERRNQRLALLQDIFRAEMAKADPGFFVRLQEGALHVEDKSVVESNNLFADPIFQDKEYYKKYPTIYHLRDELMRSTESHDIRLVYLAIHHIIKKRGHFLFPGDMEGIPQFRDVFGELMQEIHDAWDIALDMDAEQVQDIMKSRQNRTQKHRALRAAAGVKANCPEDKALKAMAGLKFKLSDFYEGIEADADLDINFDDDKIDEVLQNAEDMLGGDAYVLVKLKALSDWCKLSNIIKDYSSLSHAKVMLYREHKQDLQSLKRVIRQYLPACYFQVFRSTKEKHNYVAYIGYTQMAGKTALCEEKRCGQEDFNKYIEKLLSAIEADDALVKALREKAAARDLLPKITSKENGLIPFQLHRQELKAILDKASGYLPFLTQKDADGLTPCDKILQILTFRIPYYVGPLNNLDPHAKNTWVVRRSQEKIYPWNFETVVDLEACQQEFMTRLTNECTYLKQCRVLPRQSILYSKYTVLNELNNLKIDGEKITVELKQRIFEDLFLKRNRVSLSALTAYLKSQGLDVKKEQITGIDRGFQATMRPYIAMKDLLGDAFSEELAEELIYDATVFGDDPDALFRRLKRKYAGRVDGSLLKKASRMRFTGWGRLSREFLQGIVDRKFAAPFTQAPTIMEALEQTNCNLMQLLSGDMGFMEAIKAHNAPFEQAQGLTYDVVKNLYVSPAVKRQLWQAMLVVKELRKVLGHDPKRIFVEMAREEGEKKRTVSRKKQLSDLYKALKDESRDWVAEIEEKEESDFRRDRLYLYYTQMGKCLYTGRPIDIDELFNENRYDIDHIYPQSKMKDDSLNNRVLVERDANAKKGDRYPLDPDIQAKNKAFWYMLLSKGLMSRQKYDRLTRAFPLTEDELGDFVARQLVETRQSTKAFAALMEDLFPQTDVVYVKAGLVSDFRHEQDLLKCREINDLHHAKDAYLNIVVGNVYDAAFTRDPRRLYGKKPPSFSVRRLFDFDVKRGGQVVWAAEQRDENKQIIREGTLTLVRDTMRKNNILVTRMVYTQHGALFDVQLVRKNQWQLPTKAAAHFADPGKYGGYNKVTGAHFMLVEHTVKKKRVRSLIDMPLHLMERRKDAAFVTAMLEKDKGLEAPQVIMPYVGINSLLVLDGFRCNLKARTNERIVFSSAHELVVPSIYESYLRRILKFCERSCLHQKQYGTKLSIISQDGITNKQNLELYDFYLQKLALPFYQSKLSKQLSELTHARMVFEFLASEEQCYVLKNILSLFTCNRTLADLTLLKLAKNAGMITNNKTLSSLSSAYIIHQSVTGLFERKVDLLK